MEPWLKVKRENVFAVDYNDLDKAIQCYFGRKDYECVAANEWNNYTSYDFNIDTSISDYDMHAIDEFRNGKGYGSYLTRALLCKMCADNIIEPGKYIIKVYW